MLDAKSLFTRLRYIHVIYIQERDSVWHANGR